MMIINQTDFQIQTKPLNFNETDRALLLGPLAHISSLITINYCLGFRNCLGFSSGDPLKFAQDCQILKPTMMLLIPKLTNALYSNIMDGINQLTGCKRLFVDRALATKLKAAISG